jgi:FG-GAP-like repeat
MAKVLRAFFAATACLASVTTAEADVTRSGATTMAINATTRGSDVAYDSINNVYLVVGSNGVLNGQFVDRNGVKVGGTFGIQGNPALFAHFPSVAFSPAADGGAGAFLVVWHQSDVPAGTSIHTRIVSFSKGGAIGGDNQVSVEGSYWERTPGVAYSIASREFLITYPRAARGIRGVRVDLNGAALAAPFSIAVNGQSEEWSSVAYSPTNNQYIVAYEAFTTFGTVYARAVQAGSDSLVGTDPTTVYAGGANYINEIAYNADTNQFLIAWSALASKVILGRVLNADLSMPGNVTAISSLWQAYDGLGLDYNRLTRTFFMVSHDGRGLATSYEDGGVEVLTSGNPVDNGFLVTQHADTKGNFYPKIAAGAADPRWLVSTAHGFLQADIQLLASGGAPPPPPPPPVGPNPQLALDSPNGGTMQQPFLMRGWAVDLGATSGTGADTVHVWAWPLSGAPPIFIGAGTPSNARPDVGALFGSQFTNSGYGVSVRGLASGGYTLAVYMHSTVTNTFNAVRTVNVQINGSAAPVNGPIAGGDVDGDALSEITVYNQSTGTWSALLSGSGWTTSSNVNWGGGNFEPVAGDFDGDGRADLGVYVEPSGGWYVLLAGPTYSYSTTIVKSLGGTDWIPVPADYDGDGKTDFVVYNRRTGAWYGLYSSSGYTTTFAINYGGSFFTPVPGDFDGDGKADIGVYDIRNGNWSILLSSSGYTNALNRAVGGPGWRPVASDYDGDGKTDLAVYNDTTGVWYVLKSASGNTATLSIAWGGTGFTAVKGDYDGDGKADLALYQSATGTWSILLSGSGYTTARVVNWGGAGYIAIPAFF